MNTICKGDRIQAKLENGKVLSGTMLRWVSDKVLLIGRTKQGPYAFPFTEKEVKKYGFRYGWTLYANQITLVTPKKLRRVRLGSRVTYSEGYESRTGTVVGFRKDGIFRGSLVVGLDEHGSCYWEFNPEESKKYGFKYGWYVHPDWVTKVLKSKSRTLNVGDQIRYRVSCLDTPGSFREGTILEVCEGKSLMIGTHIHDEYSWKFDSKEVKKYGFPCGWYAHPIDVVKVLKKKTL